MRLKIDDLTHYAISGKTFGYDIIKGVEKVNYAFDDVCTYGYHRVLAELPTDIVRGIDQIEKILPELLEQALCLQEGRTSVERFVKYANALVRGYQKMLDFAKQGGLAKLDVCELTVAIEQDDGSTNIVYLTQNEDTKKALLQKLGSDIVVYTSKEMALILDHDNFTHAIKQHWDARLTSVEVNNQSENN